MAFFINASAMFFATSPAGGADSPLWAAIAPELEGVTGKFLGGRKEKESKFREPGPIAELEKACEQLVAQAGAAAIAAAPEAGRPTAGPA